MVGERVANPEKFCIYCGRRIPGDALVCPYCGRSLIPGAPPAAAVPYIPARACDKWLAFVLCFFFGILGAHKFYEGKVGMGLLYLFTAGLFGIGWLVDCIVLLCRPNPYYLPYR